ncbi:ImmA/IrrE family metallo-endopeptidase [Mucilaginibacter sp. KACC 22063]|uniref:ImmA/IrrE family metallo-endopeptidase n=1 Tax=Mucilaginibacter sp. KACC 22063 TaxID=3025666 RepID=UPI0023672490|nr:ImmA/IrrE family metallo-endopeptidase [Mucilaginibacter sp. KACC 22063]WDF54338.1 ImmA/IrrE family metallo-endopeptidase [Mucilaginibacter sp. KACC 22063]
MGMVNNYAVSVAKEFWSATGLSTEPPFDIAGAVSLLFPIDIVQLSELSTAKIDHWFSARNVNIQTHVQDRPLHGFVVFSRGVGFMFINGTDDEQERRYTIAHEVSHFLLDYKIPRDKIIKKLGAEVEEVLDGIREPSSKEMVEGIIKHVAVKPFTHLLEKEGDGSFENLQVYYAENNADTLALELLAPASRIKAETLKEKKKLSHTDFCKICNELLVHRYKLPTQIATDYAKVLAYRATGGPSIMDKLGF